MTDELLERIKELRPRVTQGEWEYDIDTLEVSAHQDTTCLNHGLYDEDEANANLIALAPAMADRIIADAEEREQDALIIAKSAEREAALLGKIERLREAIRLAIQFPAKTGANIITLDAYNGLKQAFEESEES